eukprot:2522121-Lingulodinium_polyedra.AAC.1
MADNPHQRGTGKQQYLGDRLRAMADDSTQLSDPSHSPPELLRSALVSGHVEHTAKLAVCSPTLLGCLV